MDIFSSSALAIVNPVNCEGVMGKGLALEFKQRYPGAYAEYVAACRSGELDIGKCQLNWLDDGPFRWAIQFPTKRYWRQPSRLEYIEAGLDNLVEIVRMNAIPSIAIPALGCGCGALDWRRVRPMIEQAFSSLDGHVDLHLYEPLDETYRRTARRNF